MKIERRNTPVKNRRFVRINEEVHDITDITHHFVAHLTKDSSTVILYVTEIPSLDLVGNSTWVEWSDGTIGNELVITDLETPNENLLDYIDKYKDPVIEEAVRYRQFKLKHGDGKLTIENAKNPTFLMNIGLGKKLRIEYLLYDRGGHPVFGEYTTIDIIDRDNNLLHSGMVDTDMVKQLRDSLTMVLEGLS